MHFRTVYVFLVLLLVVLWACAWDNSAVNLSETPIDSSKDRNEKVDETLILGVEQLEAYLPLLSGKNIAVVANQSSIVEEKHLIDLLIANQIAVKKVFSPEHGFRGEVEAGANIYDYVDSATQLPVVSLYGKIKKPKSKDLAQIDCIVFDLQDVGVRFYTYISTLHYVMEAAAENNVEVIVLDRPNPNGHIVDGPVRKSQFKSFIGMHPVPILYGMTIGEYAQMINGEKWLSGGITCALTVIAIKNYTHQTPYSLPIAPSPNLKTDNAIGLYPGLCLLEGTIVSVGRGTDWPFELFGHPDFPEREFYFTPKARAESTNPKLNGKRCFGVDLRKDERSESSVLQLDFLFAARNWLYPKHGEKWIDRPQFFNLMAGNNQLIKQLTTFASEEEIRQSWKKDLEEFHKIRMRYLLYD